MTTPAEILQMSVQLHQKFQENMRMYSTACFCDEKLTSDVLRERMHTLLDALLDNVYLSQQMLRGGYEQDESGSPRNPQ